MPDFPGRFTVVNSQSNLDNDLLLRAGFPDATQAIMEATRFLLKTKQLIPGQQIIVRGQRGTFGGVSIIVMTDARADVSQPFGFTVAAAATAKSVNARMEGSKKAGSKKSAAKSRAGSKGASKKSKGARKRGAAKPSKKK